MYIIDKTQENVLKPGVYCLTFPDHVSCTIFSTAIVYFRVSDYYKHHEG